MYKFDQTTKQLFGPVNLVCHGCLMFLSLCFVFFCFFCLFIFWCWGWCAKLALPADEMASSMCCWLFANCFSSLSPSLSFCRTWIHHIINICIFHWCFCLIMAWCNCVLDRGMVYQANALCKTHILCIQTN